MRSPLIQPEHVTIVQNTSNDSLDFILHDSMEVEELEIEIQTHLGMDITEYNWQTYETE